MLNYQEIVTIEEKVDLNEKLITSCQNQNWIWPEDFDSQTFLTRNLKTGTFKLELGIYNYQKKGDDIPYVVINNEIYHTGKNNNNLYYYKDKKYQKDFKYFVPYPAIKSTKFHDLNVAVFGVDNQKIAPYNHFLIAPKFKPLPKFIHLKNEQVLLIKTIKKIGFKLPKDLMKKPHQSEEFVPEIKLFYNYMFLVPQKLSQIKHNKTLFKVYLKNDDDSKFYNDYILNDGLLKTTSINKNLQVYLKETEVENIKKSFNGLKANFIGDINVTNSLTYDYDKKRVIEDFNENSDLGDLVPFHFKGDYKREISLNLNESFKKITICLLNKIERPLLDVDEGIVDLKIENNQEHLQFDKMITQKNIQFIKKRLNEKNFDYFSLIGIEKLSKRIK